MHDVAVLFIHHADDPTTRNNLAAVRHYNPGVPVIPVSNWGVTLPDGHHSREMIAGWSKLLPPYRGRGLRGLWRRFKLDLDRGWIWRNVDLIAYLWITWNNRPIEARRWVVFEWDIYCNTNLREWFGASFDGDLVTSFLQKPGPGHPFPHFNQGEVAIIPEPLRPHMMGANPWAGILMSDKALKAIAERVRQTQYAHAFSEVRVATVAQSLGLELTRNVNPQARHTLSSVATFTMDDIDKPSVWHRVKQHDPLTLVPPRCANAAGSAKAALTPPAVA